MRRRTATALLSLALLAGFVAFLGPRRVASDLAGADPRSVALAALATTLSLACWSEAQRSLHRAAGARVGPARFGAAYATGNLLKLTLPGGRAGGPAVMAYTLGRETRLGFERDLTVVLVGKVVGFVGAVPPAVVGLLLLSVPLPGDEVDLPFELPTTLALLALVGALALALLTRPWLVRWGLHVLARAVRATLGRLSGRVHAAAAPARVDESVDRASETLASIRGDPGALAVAVALATLGWVFAAGPLWFSFAALGHPLPFALALFLAPAGTVGNAVPLPGGVGGAELVLAALVAAFTGLPVAAVGSGVLLYRATGDGFRAVLGGLGSAARTTWES